VTSNVAFTLDVLRKLREMSGGAGILECKRAFTDAEGNLEAAVRALRGLDTPYVNWGPRPTVEPKREASQAAEGRDE
jgi:translation elongation factor EF-Ts